MVFFLTIQNELWRMMHKRCVLFLLVASAMIPFHANAEWTLVAKQNGGSAYANLQTVETKDGLKTVETMFNSDKVGYLENPKEPYMSFYSVTAIDCKTNEFYLTEIKYFTEIYGRGKIVTEFEDKNMFYSEFKSIRPKHPLAKLKKVICR